MFECCTCAAYSRWGQEFPFAFDKVAALQRNKTQAIQAER